jgi:hypothetical protein
LQLPDCGEFGSAVHAVAARLLLSTYILNVHHVRAKVSTSSKNYFEYSLIRIAAMRSSVLSIIVALVAQQVTGHAIFQELWVNGVDQICDLLQKLYTLTDFELTRAIARVRPLRTRQ